MAGNWSAKERDDLILTTAGRNYEVIIIGGGITGAGIARECALRGISFCLLDKKDFAFGTSSRSSKLFHGGLRYLASGELGLVRESTSERNWLRCHFPNMVRPLGFVYPSYQKSKSTPLKVRLAVFLYTIISDCFSEFKNYRKGRIFSASFIEEFEPAITLEDPELGKMTIAGYYYDTNCDDARVTLEIIKESISKPKNPSCALNYAAVKKLIKNSTGRITGVSVQDEFSGESFDIKGSCVVSAAGIWTDEVLSSFGKWDPRIYPTKGVHIVVPAERLGIRNAFSLVSLDDGRFFFILHRGRVSVIGTTDTAYFPESKNLDEPWCTRHDCDYLLKTVNRIFPHAQLKDDDIISAYAGVRPLIRQEDARHESDVSRKHEIFQTEEGVVAIAGGKSTTHRRMAEDLLFYLVKHNLIKSFTKAEYGKPGFSKQPFKIALTRKEFDQILSVKNLWNAAHPVQLEYYYTQFGRGGIKILEAIQNSPDKGKSLLEGYPHCRAEIEYILDNEFAPKLIDILCRRTEAQWTIWHYKQSDLASAVAEIMADYYSWDDSRMKTEIDEYLKYVKNNVRFLNQISGYRKE
ncbi:MAG: glycerol-3-phosphate dehydrogenase/oxidase [Firmicutes bacterium]|nr:glycerol-3-phosphate dehydrogenase/oxidase [Bacillota bacterium]